MFPSVSAGAIPDTPTQYSYVPTDALTPRLISHSFVSVPNLTSIKPYSSVQFFVGVRPDGTAITGVNSTTMMLSIPCPECNGLLAVPKASGSTVNVIDPLSSETPFWFWVVMSKMYFPGIVGKLSPLFALSNLIEESVRTTN